MNEQDLTQYINGILELQMWTIQIWAEFLRGGTAKQRIQNSSAKLWMINILENDLFPPGFHISDIGDVHAVFLCFNSYKLVIPACNEELQTF